MNLPSICPDIVLIDEPYPPLHHDLLPKLVSPQCIPITGMPPNLIVLSWWQLSDLLHGNWNPFVISEYSCDHLSQVYAHEGIIACVEPITVSAR